jgi:sporulation protein YlmC with PRC-barrel domain
MKSLSVAAIAVLLASASVAIAAEPATTTTTTHATDAATGTAANGRFRASKLDGVAVYNQQNEKIGTIQDLVLAADGRVETVVVAVGGFLGMGERNVGIPFAQVKWSNDRTAADASGNPSTSSSTITGTTGSGATAAANRWYPDHATIDASKDQLKQMPEFKF